MASAQWRGDQLHLEGVVFPRDHKGEQFGMVRVIDLGNPYPALGFLDQHLSMAKQNHGRHDGKYEID